MQPEIQHVRTVARGRARRGDVGPGPSEAGRKSFDAASTSTMTSKASLNSGSDGGAPCSAGVGTSMSPNTSAPLRALRLLRLARVATLLGLTLPTGPPFAGRSRERLRRRLGPRGHRRLRRRHGGCGAELGGRQPTSLSDALCWAATTVTTVGYGDRNPTTGLGRLIALIAVALLLVGIALLGRCDGVCGGVLRQSAPGRTGGRGTHRGDPW